MVARLVSFLGSPALPAAEMITGGVLASPDTVRGLFKGKMKGILTACESHPDSIASSHESGPAGSAENSWGDVVGEEGSGLSELVDVRCGEAAVAETSKISNTEIIHQQDDDVGRPTEAVRE